MSAVEWLIVIVADMIIGLVHQDTYMYIKCKLTTTKNNISY